MVIYMGMMKERSKRMKKKLTIGILAHVDAGKTTLSEALLYLSGKIRTYGRVDHGNTYLDMEMGTYLTSKREEANMLGKEDYKLAEYCRRMLAKSPSPALKKQLDKIVSDAASGDMKSMEEARLKLLNLAEKLSE